MRITGGRACGLKISTLSGRDIRPTADRVRESLFQILSVRFGHDWSGVRVLDLFAGSGSLGMEALSRGAEHAVFADISPRSLACIRNNLAQTGFLSLSTLLRLDVRKARPAWRALKPHAPFDLLLADPPYSRDFPGHIISLACSFPLLVPQGLLVIEEFRGVEMPETVKAEKGKLVLDDRRTYGQTLLCFYSLHSG
jgi:16S rRNA (guanine966-N2)-methyltransferase